MSKKRIFISAIYTSPPTSMGGNTKIIIEMINNSSDDFHFVVLTSQPETFRKNIYDILKIDLVSIDYPYTRNNPRTHIEEIKYIFQEYTTIFTDYQICSDDVVITQSDFAPDVVPVFLLQKKYSYKRVPTLFLFIPNPLLNFIKGYFPFLKYCVYRVYQRIMFVLMKLRGAGYIITNHSDLSYFNENDKVLPIYGGVNLEQIQPNNPIKKYDAIFCSRLHPQKGVSGLLDIWARVIELKPEAKLAIIGNGERSYEEFLYEKCKKLSLDKSIERLGYVNNSEKYSLYAVSRMLLHATIYDNNGMVAAEALCQGLPVIMYDLPDLKTVYTRGCSKVKVGDQQMFADKIIDLINEPTFLTENDILLIKKQWSWEKKALLFKKFIASI